MHGNATGVTCENCHGAGKAHVDGGGDVTKIFDPAKASAKDVDANCLSCHAGAHPDFERSPHAKANVSCISCHSIHGSKEETLLKAAAHALLPVPHRREAGVRYAVPPPGERRRGQVQRLPRRRTAPSGTTTCRSTADQNMICTKCHTETRGPFVYEHAAVKAEGCLGCHTPHGSQNARMLNMPSINTLCNQCHSPVAAATVHGMGAGSAEMAPCTSCHTYIHGSNINPAFLR